MWTVHWLRAFYLQCIKPHSIMYYINVLPNLYAAMSLQRRNRPGSLFPGTAAGAFCQRGGHLARCSRLPASVSYKPCSVSSPSWEQHFSQRRKAKDLEPVTTRLRATSKFKFFAQTLRLPYLHKTRWISFYNVPTCRTIFTWRVSIRVFPGVRFDSRFSSKDLW